MSLSNKTDISYSLGGNLSAVCDHSNTIYITSRLIINKQPKEGQTSIVSSDPQEKYIKSKFAHNKYGKVLGALTETHNCLYLYKYSKISLLESSWVEIARISLSEIEDFDFINNTSSYRMKIVLVTKQGKAYVFEASDFTLQSFNMIWNAQVNSSGCSAVTCNNYEGFNEEFIIGCYSGASNDLLQIYKINKEGTSYIKQKTIQCDSSPIISAKWAYQLGTNFFYLCVSNKAGYVYFYKITTDYKSCVKVGEYRSIKGEVDSLNWNISNKILTGICSDGSKLIFKRKTDKEEFVIDG